MKEDAQHLQSTTQTDNDKVSHLMKIVDGLKVRSIVEMKSLTGCGCIIDVPHSTMKQPYLGEEYLDDAMEIVKENLKEPPGTRSKPVIMTVGGTGGGKTRTFEEIRRKVNEDDGLLAIAITFNNLTPYAADTESFTKDGGLYILLSIMCRIVAVVYEVRSPTEFLDLKSKMEQLAAELDLQESDKKKLFNA